MNNQKVNFIPTYNGVPITNYTPTQDSIFLDVIDMPEANKAWSLQIMATSEGVVDGQITIFAGNSLDIQFVQYTEPTSFTDTPVIISESNFNYRYMLLLISFSEIESISISMVK